MTTREMITLYMPWFLSAISVGMMYLAGSVHKKAWLLGLVAQAFWLVWILCSANYGFLIQNIALWIVYIRNHLLWSKIKKNAESQS